MPAGHRSDFINGNGLLKELLDHSIPPKKDCGLPMGIPPSIAGAGRMRPAKDCS